MTCFVIVLLSPGPLALSPLPSHFPCLLELSGKTCLFTVGFSLVLWSSCPFASGLGHFSESFQQFHCDFGEMIVPWHCHIGHFWGRDTFCLVEVAELGVDCQLPDVGSAVVSSMALWTLTECAGTVLRVTYVLCYGVPPAGTGGCCLEVVEAFRHPQHQCASFPLDPGTSRRGLLSAGLGWTITCLF